MDDWITCYDDIAEPCISESARTLKKDDSNSDTKAGGVKDADGIITHQPELSNRYTTLNLDCAAA